MKRRSSRATQPTFNDSTRRYHQCQWNIYKKRARNWCRNFRLTQSPLPAFLSWQTLMQRRNRTKTTKARNRSFVFFHLFFHTIHPPSIAPSLDTSPRASAWSSCMVINWWSCSVSSFKVWAGAADRARRAGLLAHRMAASRQKQRRVESTLNFAHCRARRTSGPLSW